MDVSVIAQILHLAALIAPDGGDAALVHLAQERGWLDASGNLTDTGKELHQALLDQRETRSIYRLFL